MKRQLTATVIALAVITAAILALGSPLRSVTPVHHAPVAQAASATHSPILAQHQRHWRHWCRTHWRCLKHHWWVRYPKHSEQARRAWCRYFGHGPACWLPGTWEADWLTCYTPGGITANGYPAVPGIAAAGYGVAYDTRYWIPLMHMVYMVEDRGGLVADGHLDLVVNGCSDSGFPTGEYWVKRLR